MILFQELTRGFLLGIVLSPACFGACFPLLLPYFGSEERRAPSHVYGLLRFLSGRLVGYALIGALAGWAGQAWLLSLQHAKVLEAAGYSGVGLILVAYGLLKHFPQWGLCRWLESVPGIRLTPWWLGLFTGINICPPFITALFEAARAGGLTGGLSVFLGFFLGTSLILLPVFLTGFLARQEALRMAARWAAILIGAWFVWKGIWLLFF